ncbi:hypothetical protein V8J36_12260 [Frigidibacter sp. MR17.14]|uniref:hypothetical protein n=1 Tax=Frigidibacter sp. MR17.14 TaxID=3126509 RepID=UPI003012C5D1
MKDEKIAVPRASSGAGKPAPEPLRPQDEPHWWLMKRNAMALRRELSETRRRPKLNDA